MTSWTSASTCEPGIVAHDGLATTEAGRPLHLVRAGGWWGRARGLLRLPGLIDDEPPVALWLGRTPQVHTFGMAEPIAVATAEITRHGRHRGRPCALRLRRVDVLTPGRLGPWSWGAPATFELHPEAARRLGLGPGSALTIEWGCAGAARRP